MKTQFTKASSLYRCKISSESIHQIQLTNPDESQELLLKI